MTELEVTTTDKIEQNRIKWISVNNIAGPRPYAARLQSQSVAMRCSAQKYSTCGQTAGSRRTTLRPIITGYLHYSKLP
jgi:hypothetical protein